MERGTKLFAFKLAESRKATAGDTKWKAREGVSIAGCTAEAGDTGEYREEYSMPFGHGYYVGVDKGWNC